MGTMSLWVMDIVIVGAVVRCDLSGNGKGIKKDHAEDILSLFPDMVLRVERAQILSISLMRTDLVLS